MKYKCSGCGTEHTDKTKMLAKRISFHRIGSGNKLVRSRTKGWLCDNCLSNDVDWNAEEYEFQRTTQKEKVVE